MWIINNAICPINQIGNYAVKLIRNKGYYREYIIFKSTFQYKPIIYLNFLFFNFF